MAVLAAKVATMAALSAGENVHAPWAFEEAYCGPRTMLRSNAEACRALGACDVAPYFLMVVAQACSNCTCHRSRRANCL